MTSDTETTPTTPTQDTASYDEKIKHVSIIAKPLASRKMTKKLHKLVKKSTKCKVTKRGVKEVVKALRKKSKGVLLIAGDISPVDVIAHLPVLCEENDVPYMFVPSKFDLGAAASSKRPTSCILITPGKDKFAAQELYDELHAEVKEKQYYRTYLSPHSRLPRRRPPSVGKVKEMGQKLCKKAISDQQDKRSRDTIALEKQNQARIQAAEDKLQEFAREYAVKRRAGLVPTRPVPARTLLWQEVSRRRVQGSRGGCIFNRSGVDRCYCTHYSSSSQAGNCDECSHGACWHKIARPKQREPMPEPSPIDSVWDTMEAIKMLDSDDESIANEMAKPLQSRPIFPSTGFDQTLSAPNKLQEAIKAMDQFRQQGLTDDEIEYRIQQDMLITY